MVWAETDRKQKECSARAEATPSTSTRVDPFRFHVHQLNATVVGGSCVRINIRSPQMEFMALLNIFVLLISNERVDHW